jgi:phosphoribosylglycinamide formyltransferase-1
MRSNDPVPSPAVGVLVSGVGSNLQALIDADIRIGAVAANVRGIAALDRAASAGIPTAVFVLGDYADREARDSAMADWLVSHDVSIVVCAGYMHLLRPGFLTRFPARVVNVHPALLPAFPGAHAVEDALAAGVEVTGATVHLVDEGLDTGTVLRQEPVVVLPGDTPETLHARIRSVEHRLLPEVVRELQTTSRRLDGGGSVAEPPALPAVERA